jgi:bifunctional non-homologous end joining protein LigD
MVEDHPIPYMYFEGKIPDGEYGAGLVSQFFITYVIGFLLVIGEVRTWDTGTYEPLDDVDMNKGIEKGKLTFRLHGKKLKGEFHMIRPRFRSNQRANQWLLLKKKDLFANKHFVLERVLDYGSRRDLQPSTTTKEKKHRQSETISPEQGAKIR